MAKNSNKNHPNDEARSEILIAAFKQFGFLLPENEQEIEQFENTFGTTKIDLPEELQDGNWIFAQLNDSDYKPERKSTAPSAKKKSAVIIPVGTAKAVKSKAPEKDYFKKLVLAAEIASQLHGENTFGHVKFVKLLYLSEQVCNIHLSTEYRKFAAGPFDGKLIHTVDAEFKKRDWFDVSKSEYGFKYEPGTKLESYKTYYERYFSKQKDKINNLLNLLRGAKTDFCEIVATLFYVWKEIKEKNQQVNDELIIQGFYAWHDAKKRFTKPQLNNALAWMREKEIHPDLL